MNLTFGLLTLCAVALTVCAGAFTYRVVVLDHPISLSIPTTLTVNPPPCVEGFQDADTAFCRPDWR